MERKMNEKVREIEKETAKTFDFAIGDTVDVHVRITEGEKTRIQIFTGTVISRSGRASNEQFTVRKMVASQGVERTFPMNSPAVAEVNVTRKGKVRRAKLYYLRDRIGKATKVKAKL